MTQEHLVRVVSVSSRPDDAGFLPSPTSECPTFSSTLIIGQINEKILVKYCWSIINVSIPTINLAI